MAHGYAVTNAAAGLASSAFTFTNWTASNKSFLNDAAMDRVCSTGTATGTVRYIDIDFGSATSIKGFALLNHNIASWTSTTIGVYSADDAAFSVNVYGEKDPSTISVSAPNDKDTVLQFPAHSKRYWRLEFESSSTEAIRLGEIVALSSITSLTRLAAYGRGEAEQYITNRTESRTGNVRSSFLAGPVRTLRLPFVDMQGTTQRDELMAMWRATQGGVRNLLWIEYIESVDTGATAAGQACLWGKLQESLGWRETDYTIYDVDALELRQVGRDVGR